MHGQQRLYPESQYLTNAMDMAKQIAIKKIHPGDTVIDATIGNGYDTVFLSRLCGDSGKVYGFDIQKQSLINTETRLKEQSLAHNQILIQDSHEKMSLYVKEPVKLIMFNLGYLPGADQRLSTKADLTSQAVLDGLTLLDPEGIILLVNYRGHKEGKLERKALDSLLADLDQKKYSVACLEFLNQINDPPALYIIEKNQKFIK